MAMVPLDMSDCVGWNVYPRFAHGLGGMKSQQQDPYLREGADLLIQVIARLPQLRVVFVFGKATERAWDLFTRSYPKVSRSLRCFRHRSTGPMGYTGSKEQQVIWQRELFESMVEAKRFLDGGKRPYEQR